MIGVTLETVVYDVQTERGGGGSFTFVLFVNSIVFKTIDLLFIFVDSGG